LGFGAVVSGSARNELVVLFENDDGTGEFATLPVGLAADVFTKSHPPHLSFAKIEARGFVRAVVPDISHYSVHRGGESTISHCAAMICQ
jgi:hypothetical protein